jgi:broad specificity phosphatase PhoE
MYKITLLRHAESEGNVANKPQGTSDLPLTERGRRQAQALAERWKREGRQFDQALSSPLRRAKDTAEILAKTLGMEIEYEAMWIERDVGQMSELDNHVIDEHYANPRSESPYHDAFGLGGEGQWQIYLRAGQALQNLLGRPEGNYLVVSHGGLLNALLYSILGLSPQRFGSGPGFPFGNTSFVDLSYLPHRHKWNLERFNDDRHLESLDG